MVIFYSSVIGLLIKIQHISHLMIKLLLRIFSIFLMYKYLQLFKELLDSKIQNIKKNFKPTLKMSSKIIKKHTLNLNNNGVAKLMK